MKKGCLIAIIAAVAVVGGIIALVFGMTSGVAKAGDAFVAQLGSGKVAEAYQSCSPSLRAQQTQEAFEKTVKELGLTDASSASWSSRGFTNDQGYVEGTVTTKSRGSIPCGWISSRKAAPGMCIRSPRRGPGPLWKVAAAPCHPRLS